MIVQHFTYGSLDQEIGHFLSLPKSKRQELIARKTASVEREYAAEQEMIRRTSIRQNKIQRNPTMALRNVRTAAVIPAASEPPAKHGKERLALLIAGL